MFFKCTAIIVLAVILVTSTGALNVFSQSYGYEGYKVKAAFLYNFTKFVEWPADAFRDVGDPVTLCILGSDPFGDALDSIKDKTVGGRKFAVRKSLNPESLKGCHIIFVSESEREKLPAILNAVKNKHALTVGDMPGFAESGGIINLFMFENKVRFEINVDAAQHEGLAISSQLLKLARIVKEKN
ncbi:MAG: YfiR family protein [Nitrospirae bacterium]|nr:YfiR family protein [Nitrospirota bacterium]